MSEMMKPFGYVSDDKSGGYMRFQHEPFDQMHLLVHSTAPVYTAAQLQEAARQAMEECRRLVLNEVLHLEDVNCEEDVAYNTAIDHAQKAIANRIRALADVAGEKGVGK